MLRKHLLIWPQDQYKTSGMTGGTRGQVEILIAQKM